MASAETFVAELEGKNQDSFARHVKSLEDAARGDDLPVSALLKLEIKHTLEAAEASALWLGDTDQLSFKIALAAHCGACAQRHVLVEHRLAALGVTPAEFDPVAVGYSKLFGFLRSLQTVEERAAAGALTVATYALARFRLIASLAAERGDQETAALFGGALPETEQAHIHAGRLALLGCAKNEESQTRARRASFRVVELIAEIQDPTLIKRFLSRSIKKI